MVHPNEHVSWALWGLQAACDRWEQSFSFIQIYPHGVPGDLLHTIGSELGHTTVPFPQQDSVLNS